MRLTSAIMRRAARCVRENASDNTYRNRTYFVCFAVVEAAGGTSAILDELKALLTRDGKSLDGNWFKELEYGAPYFTSDLPGFVPAGPERQELRAAWCEKIADELEEQEQLALALQTR